MPLNTICQELPDKDSRKIFNDAEKLYSKNRFEESYIKFHLVLAKNPNHIETLYKLALIEYEVKKNYKIAENYFQRTIIAIDKLLANSTINLKEKQKTQYTELRFECKNKMKACSTRADNYNKNESIIQNEKVSENQNNIVEVKEIKPITNTELKKAKSTSAKNEGKKYSPIDIDDPNLAYVDSRIVSFSSAFDTELQKNQLIKHLDSIYKSYTKAMFTARHSNEQVRKINDRWMRENSVRNLEWIKELNELERKYIEKQKILNEKINENNKIFNDIKNLERDIEYLETIKKQETRYLNEINNYTNSDISEALTNKLTNIPLSVVLIGKIPFSIPLPLSQKNTDKSTLKTLKEILDFSLRKKAIELIKGNQLTSSYQFISTDNKLKIVLERKLAGRAQVAANYYKNIRKTLADNESYVFSILRIEVFPFEKETNIDKVIKDNISNQSSFENYVKIFLSDNGNTLEAFNSDRNAETISIEDNSIKFKSEEISFIKELTEESKKLNAEYQKSINEAYDDYKAELEKSKLNQLTAQNRIDTLTIRINKLNRELQEKRKIISTNYSLNSAKTEYGNAKKNYENKYKERKTYVNNIEVVDAEQTELSDEEIRKFMVNKCFSKIDEMKNERINISVYQESDETQEYKQNTKYSIEYKPFVTGFQVVTFDQIVNDGVSNYFLHVAFELKWDPTGDKLINSETENIDISKNQSKIDEKLDENIDKKEENITAIQVNQVNESSDEKSDIEESSPIGNIPDTKDVSIPDNISNLVEIDENLKTIKFLKKNIQFCFYSDNPTSFISWNMSIKNGWRLPKKDEFMLFIDYAKNQKINNNDIIQKLNPFTEPENFIIDEYFKNYNGENFHKGFVIFPDNYNLEPLDIEDGDITNILIVKDL